MRRRICVRQIHNRTHPPVEVYVPNVDGSVLTVAPGQTLSGSWAIVYEELAHPELRQIADENEMWFESPDEFTWGATTFPDPTVPYRTQVEEWIVLYEWKC